MLGNVQHESNTAVSQRNVQHVKAGRRMHRSVGTREDSHNDASGHSPRVHCHKASTRPSRVFLDPCTERKTETAPPEERPTISIVRQRHITDAEGKFFTKARPGLATKRKQKHAQ